MRVPRLLVLTDRRQLPPGHGLVETIAACAAAGATTVLLRELDLSELQRAALVAELTRHVRVLSARTDLPGVAGVHLAARQPVGEAGGRPHGRSCHDEDEVARAVRDGAAYVSVSPIAATRSKPGYGPPLGLGGARRAAAAAVGVPVLALGGVDAVEVAALRSAGMHGVAVMGAVMRAGDPAAVVSGLLAALGEER